MIFEYKGYQIKPHKDISTSYVIVTSGKGGKIPAVLEGMFTSVGFAKQLIDTYSNTKPKKEKEDAETRSTSGG